ncbi:MAG: hypothetical protein N3E47_04585 [Candidatus Bathyarchaeota archaeon]|nr:hypothetical protein [Candidatus Bathyarchaeota archaeon]
MTAFEHYFEALKKALGQGDIYEIWPDFEPEYDEREYAWATLRGLGESLLLNCGQCDGPSDMRHSRCRVCVDRRRSIAEKTYEKVMGRPIGKWNAIILCRIHVE